MVCRGWARRVMMLSFSAVISTSSLSVQFKRSRAALGILTPRLFPHRLMVAGITISPFQSINLVYPFTENKASDFSRKRPPKKTPTQKRKFSPTSEADLTIENQTVCFRP